MIAVAIGVVTCLLLATAFAHSPWRIVQVSLWLWFLVPAAVVGQQTGLALDDNKFLHPATAVVIVAVIFQVVLRNRCRRLPVVPKAGVVLVLAALTLSGLLCVTHGSGYSLWLNQWVAPLGAFYLVGVSREISTGSVGKIARSFVLAAAAAGVAAIVGAISGSMSPYQTAMRATYYWFGSDVSASRQSGTTDAPLALAFICALSVALVPAFERVATQVCLTTMLVAACVLTQARTATAICALTIAYMVFRRSTRPQTRISAVVVCTLAYVAATRFGLLEQIQSRVQDDNGSAQARSLAWAAFGEHLSDVGAFGLGPGSSVRFARNLGLVTSFESAFASYAVDFGLLAASLLFIGMVLIWLSSLVDLPLDEVRFAGFAAFCGLVLIQTSSSVGTQSATGLALWVMMSLAAFGRRRLCNLDDASAPDRVLPESDGVKSKVRTPVNERRV